MLYKVSSFIFWHNYLIGMKKGDFSVVDFDVHFHFSTLMDSLIVNGIIFLNGYTQTLDALVG